MTYDCRDRQAVVFKQNLSENAVDFIVAFKGEAEQLHIYKRNVTEPSLSPTDSLWLLMTLKSVVGGLNTPEVMALTLYSLLLHSSLLSSALAFVFLSEGCEKRYLHLGFIFIILLLLLESAQKL